jgi:hypothetical protein
MLRRSRGLSTATRLERGALRRARRRPSALPRSREGYPWRWRTYDSSRTAGVGADREGWGRGGGGGGA